MFFNKGSTVKNYVGIYLQCFLKVFRALLFFHILLRLILNKYSDILLWDSPPWPRPFFPDCLVWLEASSRNSVGGSKLLPFKNDGGHCVLGDLQCCRNGLIPFSTDPVQSITLTTGGLQSSCRNISRVINGNRMHLSSISSIINELKFQQNGFCFVITGYCVKIDEGIFSPVHFRTRL